MKFAVSASQLCERLQILKDAIPSNNSIELLAYVVFSFRNGKLTLTTSNSEMMLASTLETFDGEGEGEFAVLPTYLQTLSFAGDTPVTFVVDDDNLQVTMETATGVATVIALNADNYPYPKGLNEAENGFRVTLDVEKLRIGLSAVVVAQPDQNDFRSAKLKGIYFDFVGDKLFLVATDTNRLVRFAINDVHTDAPIANLVSLNQSKSLDKAIAKSEAETMEMQILDKFVIFRTDKYTIVGSRINEQYVNYNSVIPSAESLSHHIIVEKDSLVKSLKCVVPFVDNTKKIEIAAEANKLTISGQNADYATDAKEFIDCNYEGEPIRQAFKSEDMLRLIEKINAKVIDIGIVDLSRPGVFAPLDQAEGTDLCAIIVPLPISAQY